MRATATAAVLVLGLAVVAGCSSEPQPTAASASPPSTQPTARPTQTPQEYDLPAGDEQPYPQWDQASRAAAVAAGEAVLRAFLRPEQGVDPQGWWQRLQPLLTPAAQETYAYVDPAQVPPTAVTGPAVLLEPDPGATAFLATVQVPTDAGTYEVLLARTGGSAPWLAEQVTPPQALSGPVTAPPSPA